MKGHESPSRGADGVGARVVPEGDARGITELAEPNQNPSSPCDIAVATTVPECSLKVAYFITHPITPTA